MIIVVTILSTPDDLQTIGRMLARLQCWLFNRTAMIVICYKVVSMTFIGACIVHRSSVIELTDDSSESLVTLISELLGGAVIHDPVGHMILLSTRHRLFHDMLLPRLKQILAAINLDERDSLTIDMVHDFLSPLLRLFHGELTEEIVSILDREIALPSWVSRHFYYVKVSPIMQPLSVEVDGTEFLFTPKIATPRIDGPSRLTYSFYSVDGGIVHIMVKKSRKRWSDFTSLLHHVQRAGVAITPSTLRRAVEIFEHQFDADVFIPKDPEALFLQILHTWLSQQINPIEFANTERLGEFHDIVRSIMRPIVEIESIFTSLWTRPKQVTSVHYVISLDRIASRDPNLIVDLFQHDGMRNQFAEWRSMNIVPADIRQPDLTTDGVLHEQWQTLPIDTRYFEDLESKILGLFEDAEAALDGWLIHSDNYHALRLLHDEFRGRVKTIYVDPPFNKDYDAGFSYSVNFNDSAWVTLLDNRFRLAHDLLGEDGVMYVRCDSSGNMYVRLIMDDIFGRENFRNEIHVRRFKKNVMSGDVRRLPAGLDTIFAYSKSDAFVYINPVRPRKTVRKGFWRHMNDSSGAGTPKTFFGRTLAPPPGKHWKYSQKRIDELIEKDRLILQCRQCGHIHRRDNGQWNGCPECGADDPVPKYWVSKTDTDVLDSNWSDIYGYSTKWGFQTENSERLLHRIIEVSSAPGDLVMDFFLGSGTTVAVAHKMGRRWIGVEMGDHFNTIVLPRMKHVIAGDSSGVSDMVGWYGGGFFKYCTLEQYWESLTTI